ncbi:hypothetical protein [Photobacterium halotolerans]|uniref:Uncharacterized protein n=1 Tax=Photobacterium halotolerans TaxID=265726 RepID=A0A0F5VHV1_9GAMM|nr:hypothetical protein [Photobacterium halotolerans]KKD01417.1 hypothetical protein KY46_00885 [Photobacterium halotolerans]
MIKGLSAATLAFLTLVSVSVQGKVVYSEPKKLTLISEDFGREFELACDSSSKETVLSTHQLNQEYTLRFHFDKSNFRQVYLPRYKNASWWTSDSYQYRWQLEVLKNIAASNKLTIYSLIQGEEYLSYDVDLKGSSKLVKQFKSDCGFRI